MRRGTEKDGHPLHNGRGERDGLEIDGRRLIGVDDRERERAEEDGECGTIDVSVAGAVRNLQPKIADLRGGGGGAGGGGGGGGVGGGGGASWHAHGAAGRRGTASGAARGDARRAAKAREACPAEITEITRDHPRLPCSHSSRSLSSRPIAAGSSESRLPSRQSSVSRVRWGSTCSRLEV